MKSTPHTPLNRFAKSHALVLTLCALCVLCGKSLAQDFKTVHDGVEYAQVTQEISGLKVNMNLLRLDLTKVRLDVHHAMDAAIGMEKTSSIAMRHGAVAAINAGFFRLDTSIFAGDAAGVLMIDSHLMSESFNNRTALFLRNSAIETRVSIAPINIRDFVIINKKELTLSGINRERRKDEVVIYYPQFGLTTLTDNTGVEVVVRKGRITEVVTEKGSTPIPIDGFVVSASGDRKAELLEISRIRLSAKLRTAVRHEAGKQGFPEDSEVRRTSDAFSSAEDITNGVPQLIKDGKIDITWEQEKASKSFVETRHPRTAVAKLKDGKFLMITVDGRSESSGGISLQDLAEYLLSLGAVDAMNLDGGGSTTMFLDGKVVNTPSDKEGERKIGDAILVTLRKKRK